MKQELNKSANGMLKGREESADHLEEIRVTRTILNNKYSDDQIQTLLDPLLYKLADEPEDDQQVLWVDDCPIASFGNFSASTGKAKSKKTFNVTAMVAAALTNGTVLKYRAKFPENKRKILYFDTEQGCKHCFNVIKRVYQSAGLPMVDDDRLVFAGLRGLSPELRLLAIDFLLRSTEGVGLVIIDGLRDLMSDINNPREATDVMTLLMSWTSIYNLHIHCVIHLNKGDNNPRGHIGTELENKAESVLMLSKSRDNKDVSEVRPMHMRDKEFEPFAFTINENAIPQLVEDYKADDRKSAPPVDLFSLPVDIHKEVLDELFAGNPPTTYSALVNGISEGYASRGYVRGMNAVKKVVARMMEKCILVKDPGIGYLYDSHFTTLKE